jgi:hypothetical protein
MLATTTTTRSKTANGRCGTRLYVLLPPPFVKYGCDKRVRGRERCVFYVSLVVCFLAGGPPKPSGAKRRVDAGFPA